MTGALNSFGGILPAIGILLGGLITKSAVLFALQAGITYSKAVGKLGFGGLVGLLAAPAIIGGILGGVISAASSVPRFQDLPEGQAASITGGPAVFDSGETVVRTTSLTNMMNETNKILNKLIEVQIETTNAIVSSGRGTVSAIEGIE